MEGTVCPRKLVVDGGRMEWVNEAMISCCWKEG